MLKEQTPQQKIELLQLSFLSLYSQKSSQQMQLMEQNLRAESQGFIEVFQGIVKETGNALETRINANTQNESYRGPTSSGAAQSRNDFDRVPRILS